MKHWNIVVRGRVQGVFFRASTQETARKLDISGYVENWRDGSVHIEAEGTIKQLNEFLGWCRQGPENAVVTDVAYEECPFVGYNGFSIKR